MSAVAALVEIEVLIRQLEEGDLLADLHEESMPALAAADVEFSVHDPDSGLRERESVLASVRQGLRTLTNASGFAGLIPNVGANVVECLPDATTVDDVAAIPGRLVDVKGQAMVPGEPEFGVSEHVATVLLAAREGGATARAAVNVRYEPDVLARLEASYPAVEFDAERPTREAVRAAVSDRVTSEQIDVEPDRPETSRTEANRARADHDDVLVVYQTGAVGIEPIVYVLAPTAPEAARVVRSIV